MSNDKDNKEIDQHSGVETTGHEWDGIKELNNPSPRWWLWIFFVTVIWSIGYWVIYPSWPTLSGEGERGGLAGTAGWTQYSQLKKQQTEIMQRKAEYMNKFKRSSFEDILKDEALYAFAVAGGKAMFKDNCATCHGTGGAGAKGYPNLNDDDWLWGGTHEEIYYTLKKGVRAKTEDTRFSEMPAFDGVLEDEQIGEVADWVLHLAKGKKATEAGMNAYKENCASCHGVNGKGLREFGAPNLTDAIWFYGEGTREDIISQIKAPKHGMMPNWSERLNDETLRQLTIYVHSLGGGE